MAENFHVIYIKDSRTTEGAMQNIYSRNSYGPITEPCVSHSCKEPCHKERYRLGPDLTG